MLRLDPHLAVFRTAPDRIAIGAQQRIADLDADPTTLRGIAALTRGVLPRELAHLVGEEACEALVQALSPAFGPTVPAVATRSSFQVASSSTSPRSSTSEAPAYAASPTCVTVSVYAIVSSSSTFDPSTGSEVFTTVKSATGCSTGTQPASGHPGLVTPFTSR